MSIEDEGRQLHLEITELRPDRRRRYGTELQQRILSWVERAEASGIPRAQCVKMIGMNAVWRIGAWQRERAKAAADGTLALVQVASPSTTLSSSDPVLVTPDGYRVEGLALEQIATLLRELA